MQETYETEVQIQALGQEDPLEEGILQYSCLENPTTEEPGELQSVGSQRVRHDLATEQQGL